MKDCSGGGSKVYCWKLKTLASALAMVEKKDGDESG